MGAMGQAGGRLRRLNMVLREVIAEALQRDLSDPRLGLVTITHVQATQDLREARVFWTVLPARRRTGAASALESARGVLQGTVARELRTRHTPHLHFAYDDHQERAAELTDLIERVAAELPPEPPEAPAR